MAATEWKEETLQLEAGRLCLEFANTNDWHASEHPVERLKTYEDLVGWARRVGLLSPREVSALRLAARQEPAQAEAALERARQLREVIYRTFSALAAGRPAPIEDLAMLSAVVTKACAGQRLAQRGPGFVWVWEFDPADLDRVLWPVARSAADLLTSSDLERVGECADDRGCGWLFMDTSRNRSRRWCGMDSCGNRAKARRHYERQRRPVRAA